MTDGSPARNDWADLLAEGRLPKFALICLGVWLNAGDSLVTATIMPSVGADLGGYEYFSWATAGFFVGAILAGASAGRLSEIFGLRNATTFAGLVFAAGCALGALAPDIFTFVGGRLLQGIGSGWISGFAMVAIAVLFPPRHIARVFAAVAGVWGIATVLGPMVGGIFAETGDWRMVFWVFMAQAILFAIAAPFLLKATAPAENTGVPWLQLGVLGLAVVCIALADFYRSQVVAIGLVVTGLAILCLVFVVDARAKVRLLPHGAGNLRSVCGSGYASMFALTAGSMALTVYGPALLQTLAGLSPLWAGYAVAAEAVMWTLMAIVVAGATEKTEPMWIRLGAFCIVAGIVLLCIFMPMANLIGVIAGAGVMGAGFGLSSSLMSRRVISVLTDEDRAIGSSAIMAVRQTGSAIGAAIAGVTANLAGVAGGFTIANATAASPWIFLTGLPLALFGLWTAFRLSAAGPAHRPAGDSH
jgi:MFS family permease